MGAVQKRIMFHCASSAPLELSQTLNYGERVGLFKATSSVLQEWQASDQARCVLELQTVLKAYWLALEALAKLLLQSVRHRFQLRLAPL